MKIYKNEALTEEVVDNILEFGRLEAGEVKRYTFWVVNVPEELGEDTPILENLKFEIEHPEVEVVLAPTLMEYNAVAELIFEWRPSVTLKEGLRSPLKITVQLSN